jgi:hypothetical protein
MSEHPAIRAWRELDTRNDWATRDAKRKAGDALAAALEAEVAARREAEARAGRYEVVLEWVRDGLFSKAMNFDCGEAMLDAQTLARDALAIVKDS